jgi:hypothetical protein
MADLDLCCDGVRRQSGVGETRIDTGSICGVPVGRHGPTAMRPLFYRFAIPDGRNPWCIASRHRGADRYFTGNSQRVVEATGDSTG